MISRAGTASSWAAFPNDGWIRDTPLMHIDLDQAAAAIRNGDLVGVPTDTVYGIAADPFTQDAVERLFTLKGRPGLKPVALLVASVEQALSLASFNDLAHEMAAEHWPGGLTLVVPRLPSVPDWVGHPERGTIGVRCPDHEVVLALLELTGPLAVSSANMTGTPASVTCEEAENLFGSDVAGFLEGEATSGEASTVIDLTQPHPVVLRDGPVAPR